MSGSLSGRKFTESLLLCVPDPTLAIFLLCILVSGSIQRPCLISEEPPNVLVQEGPKPRGAIVHLFRWTMNHIFLREFRFWWKLGRIRFSTVSSQQARNIRGNLGSKMGLIRKRAKISFCELEFKNQ